MVSVNGGYKYIKCPACKYGTLMMGWKDDYSILRCALCETKFDKSILPENVAWTQQTDARWLIPMVKED